MDLDAILARRPKLALVDELAFNNLSGSRHPKRFMDIDELLAAGIDLFTTVNIQHIESLNDLVASFTRVRIRETVPDRVLEDAEIEVVDLPPDELIARLQAGKVYVPEEASRALGHFFNRSNLTALRELALRRAAQAIDAKMLSELRAQSLAGPCAAGERVLVEVSTLPSAPELVRAAKRLAGALGAHWTALHVETRRSARLGPVERQRLGETLALASSLGADTATIPAERVTEGVKRFAIDARATQIVVGKSRRSWWFQLRHGAVVDELVRDMGNVAIHVLPRGGDSVAAPERSMRSVGRTEPVDLCARRSNGCADHRHRPAAATGERAEQYRPRLPGAGDGGGAALRTADQPLVRADARLLHHCLINLLDNAGKFGAPGTPIGVVAVRGADTLTLSVVDEGPGLPPGFESAAFDRFARIEGSDRAREAPGLASPSSKVLPKQWFLPSVPRTDRITAVLPSR